MVIEHFGRAWRAYKRNFGALVSANVLALAIYAIFSVIALTVFFAAMLSQLPVTSLMLLVARLFTTGLPYLLAAVIIFLFGVAILRILQGGLLQVCADALRRKAKWRTMLKVAAARWPAILLTEIALMFILIVLMAPTFILALLALWQRSLLLGVLALPALIIGLLVYLLFIFSLYAVVLDRTGVIKGICKSIRLVRANYLDVLILVILLILLQSVISLIPYMGWVISSIFVLPYILTVCASYYLSKTRR
jgi:hypothetical protein